MKITKFILPALLFVATPVLAGDKEDIIKVHKEYKDAVISQDSEMIIKTQSKAYPEMIEKNRKLALTASKEELLKKNMFEIMTALKFRAIMNKKELEEFDIAQLSDVFAKSDANMAEVLQKQTLGEIELNGEKATAALIMDGNAIPGINLNFIEENGEWVIDVQASMDIALEAMGDQDYTAEQYVQMMKFQLKDKATDALWELPK